MEWKLRKQYALTGFFLGFAIGVCAAFGQLAFTSKSLRGKLMPYSLGICSVFFSLSGYKIGRKQGEEADIEEALGLNRASTEFFKEGRFWIAETRWYDRAGQEYFLKTCKDTNGSLCSYFNGAISTNHNLNSGSNQNVTRYHKLEIGKFFRHLKDNFPRE